MRKIVRTGWLQLGDEIATLEILEREAVTEAAGAHPLFNGVRRLEVAGVESEPSIQCDGDTINLRAEGLTGDFRKAQLARVGQTVTVRMGARGE